MVTVAIVGILGAIAIPIYNNYITKTRIADALTHGRVYAGKVAIDREERIDPPANLDYSTISLAGWEENPRVRIMLKENIVSAVLIGSDESAGGKVIVLSEESSDASVRWVCTTNLPQALIPEGCTHEAGVGQRKLLAKWTKGNEACWSPERDARGMEGWAAGPSKDMRNQRGTQRRAKNGNRPGEAKKYGDTCSGQYIDDETQAQIEAAEEARVAEAAAACEPNCSIINFDAIRAAEEAATVEEPAVVIEDAPVLVPLLLPELSPVDLEPTDPVRQQLSGPQPGDSWESSFGDDGSTACYSAANGRWEVGKNVQSTVKTGMKEEDQATIRAFADDCYKRSKEQSEKYGREKRAMGCTVENMSYNSNFRDGNGRLFYAGGYELYAVGCQE